jgi:large subunit ribosomal protein L2
MKKGKLSSKKLLTKKRPEKRLLISLKRRAGRTSSGRISVRHQGGGVKRLYRIVDFGQEKIDIPAKVIALEYDPYRTAFLALLEYKNGEKRYRIAPLGLKIGDEIICSEKTEIKTGNRLKLKNVPVGTMVYNIELEPGRGGKIVRSAGTTAKILAQEEKYTNLEMPSTEIRKVLRENYATIGTVSHPEKRYTIVGKAGTNRLKGKRPAVRGSVMNPVDHPHGGGEGRASIGLKYPKTPWGKHALGVKTRKKKWTDKYIIKRRKKKKR